MADVDLHRTLDLSVVLVPLFDEGVGNFDSGLGQFDDGGVFAEMAVAKAGAVALDTAFSSSFVAEGFLSRTLTLNIATSDILYNFLESQRALDLDVGVGMVAGGFADTNAFITVSVSTSATKDLLSRSDRTVALDLSVNLGTYRWGDQGETEDSGIYSDVAPTESDPFTDVGTAP